MAAGRQNVNQKKMGHRHIRWTTRIVAAWLALSVVFMLTPCCDVQAALLPGMAHAAVSDHAAVSHGHGDDNNPPCAAWLDRNDALPVEAGALPAMLPKLAIPVQIAFLLPPVSFAAAVRQPLVASASPPRGLYLRYQRLIL